MTSDDGNYCRTDRETPANFIDKLVMMTMTMTATHLHQVYPAEFDNLTPRSIYCVHVVHPPGEAI
jgi:hypothetical protein